VTVITPDWLERMIGQCQRKEVGIVGVKLYYPDDTIQHAGVVVGLGGVAAHVLCKLPRDAEGYMGRLRCVQEISAVTAACMMEKAFFILALVFSPSCSRNVVSRSNMASEIFLFSFSQYSKSSAPFIKFIVSPPISPD